MNIVSKLNRSAWLAALITPFFAASCKKQENSETNLSNATLPKIDRKYLYAGIPIQTRTANQSHKIKLLENIGYAVGYDETRHLPSWVAYRLTEQGTVGSNRSAFDRKDFEFRTDTRTDSKITQYLFNRSGYQRGHMAPNDAIGVIYGKDGQSETFFMSNIAPQKKSLNIGIWARLENAEQNRWANKFQEIWVIVGTIVSEEPERIRNRNKDVAIPEKFFRIYIDEAADKIKILAFIIPHEAKSGDNLLNFIASVKEIEDQSHFDFNPDLPDALEASLEQNKATELWPLK